jgi:Protein of unknown function (DUF3604)
MRKMKLYLTRLAILLSSSFMAPSVLAMDDGDGTDVTCDNYYEYNFPFFGDTHVHTTISVDAYTQGVDTTMQQAYDFARGAQIGLHPFDENGQPTRFAQIERPLDFVMLSDHAEFFGEYFMCLVPGNPAYDDPDCVLLRQRDNTAFLAWNSLNGAPQDNVSRFDFCGPDGQICSNFSTLIWSAVQQRAQDNYDTSSDCSFTTFIGYEWTGAPTMFNEDNDLETINLHRNVLFRNSNVPGRPSSYLDAPYPEDLWSDLQNKCLAYEDVNNPEHECDVITIPHNSNLSQGLIFEALTPAEEPYNAFHSWQRSIFEPLVEVIQHKGQSECHPLSGDEQCSFEFLPFGHLAGGGFLGPTEPKIEGTIRHTLTEGLLMQQDGRGNPYKYGFIGSTDTHLGTPGLTEEAVDYPGHGGASQAAGPLTGISDIPEYNPGGLAVVWARQNSRGALFDAMKRRETYATSGPRHVVRFFGGWDIPANACSLPDMVEVAYATGVPMGSNFTQNIASAAPNFLVSAMMDAGTASMPGTDLQRIQIIKGWTDAAGQKHEIVHDVAGDPNSPAGVNLNSCATTGTGHSNLCTVWQDPDFDSSENAYYYARVLENPSCRWTHRQCLAAAVDCNAGPAPAGYESCCDTDIPKTIQERSWTSPVWYSAPDGPPPPGC